METKLGLDSKQNHYLMQMDEFQESFHLLDCWANGRINDGILSVGNKHTTVTQQSVFEYDSFIDRVNVGSQVIY